MNLHFSLKNNGFFMTIHNCKVVANTQIAILLVINFKAAF